MFATGYTIDPGVLYAIAALLFLVLGAVWRAGSRMGVIVQMLKDHDRRLDDLEEDKRARTWAGRPYEQGARDARTS